ncbi:MAG: hypothetical protein JRM99_06090 [Nitrososphaerota archaeon]|nr:hypothetical protein [Nitrososphaerota archaeon]
MTTAALGLRGRLGRVRGGGIISWLGWRFFGVRGGGRGGVSQIDGLGMEIAGGSSLGGLGS